jgi:predicted MFS family arabinose efflux permease
VAFELLGAALICLPLVIDGVAIVFVTAALLAGQRTATGAIRQAAIAEGVPERHRGPLVALSTAVDQGGQVLGYLTGAAVYLLISPAAALLLDAGSFVVAALVLVGIHLPGPETGDEAPAIQVRTGPTAGLAIIRDQPVLRLFAVLVVATAAVGALPETLAPTLLDPDDARASLLLAAAPLGQAVTITVLGRTRLVGRPWFQLGHLGLLAAALGIAALAPGVGGLIVANLLVGAGVAWVLGPQLTFLRLVPPARMAQVTGLMWAVIAVAEGGGAVALGALADATGPRSAYAAAGLLIAIAAIPGAIAARRSRAVTELDLAIREEIAATRS